ncbi:hypothetical protein EWI07_01120 [Sporolactobacillus sp. THM7-4]|nr:hypothetical protein EWI07_01120 [Sporolactobacillus sp. THM7-4]
MIYQLKITLKGKHPTVWIRFRLDSKTTFQELHEYIQVAFACHEEIHEFVLPNTVDNTEMNNSFRTIFPGFVPPGFIHHLIKLAPRRSSWGNPLNQTVFDERDYSLEQLLNIPGNKGIYTIGSEQNREYEILLEGIFTSGKRFSPLICTQISAGFAGRLKKTSPLNFSREGVVTHSASNHLKVILEAMNQALHTCQHNKLNEKNQVKACRFAKDKNQWQELLSVSSQLNKLQPWKWLASNQLIVVDLPGMNDRAYCCILGSGGEEFGLAAYIGRDGLYALNQTFQEMDESNYFNILRHQRGFHVSFTSLDQLTDKDHHLIKHSGFRFRGKKQWPMFRSCIPGYYTWYLENDEILLLKLIIEQVIEAAKWAQSAPEQIPPYDADRWFLRTYRNNNDNHFEWETQFTEPERDMKPWSKDVPLYETEMALKRLKKSTSASKEWSELDTFYITKPAQEKEGTRPFYPKLFVVVDHRLGFVIYYEMIDPKSIADQTLYERTIQHLFLNFIKKTGHRPSGIMIEDERLLYILRPLCRTLGILCSKTEKLHHIAEVRHDMKQLDTPQ